MHPALPLPFDNSSPLFFCVACFFKGTIADTVWVNHLIGQTDARYYFTSIKSRKKNALSLEFTCRVAQVINYFEKKA